MKIAVFTDDNCFTDSLIEALTGIGHQVSEIDIRWAKRPDVDGFDLVFVKGYRKGRLVAQWCTMPCFVLDWGYFNRVNERHERHVGHWQISYRELNRLPEFPCDELRLAGVEFLDREPKPDGYVLLLGQMPGDAAVKNHKLWLKQQVDRIRAEGERVIYRPHPRGGVSLRGVQYDMGTLQEALAECKYAACYNSNAGHEALMWGVPVVCDPCAPYYELSGKEIPSMEKRRAYFARASYGQWRMSELPQAVDFVINTWLPRLM